MQPFHLNKTSRIPYYYQIEEWLRGQIESGALKPGDPLPSEMALAKQWGVSRIVVRQALNDLTGEGLLVRRRALGTTVAPPRRQVPILRDRLRGLTEDLAREGLTVRSRVLSQGLVPAGGEAMHELQVEVETPLVEIRRLRSAQNTPIVIETTYHPYARFPDLLHIDLTDRSTYAILEQELRRAPGAVARPLCGGGSIQRGRRPARDRARRAGDALQAHGARPERADHGVHHFHLPRRPVPVRHRVQGSRHK